MPLLHPPALKANGMESGKFPPWRREETDILSNGVTILFPNHLEPGSRPGITKKHRQSGALNCPKIAGLSLFQ
jgi:hypothetical protein